MPGGVNRPSAAVQPPSTKRTDPVTKLAASEARNTAAPTISSGRPAVEDALGGVGVVPRLVGLDRRGQRRLDDAGRDRVHAHAVRPELGGRGPRELDDARLGRGVGRLAGLDDLRSDRREEDDAALSLRAS